LPSSAKLNFGTPLKPDAGSPPISPRPFRSSLPRFLDFEKAVMGEVSSRDRGVRL